MSQMAPPSPVAAHSMPNNNNNMAAASAVGTTGPAGAAGAGPTELDMANTKEKTPMCHLNELARFNKLQPQYELLEETGPAHEKQFTVQLVLGGKKYEAKGTSIKKAQHIAAKLALQTCHLPVPKPRSPSVHKSFQPNPNSLTATVELNSKAMKAGVMIQYTAIGPDPSTQYNYYRGGRGGGPFRNPRFPPHGGPGGMGGMPGPPPHGDGMRPPPGPGMGGGEMHGGDMRGNEMRGNEMRGGEMRSNEMRGPPPQSNYRGHHGPRPPYYPRYGGPRPLFYVKVMVSNREFIGEGRTRKDARQNAALKALKSLEADPLPERKDEAVSTADLPSELAKSEEDSLKSDISVVFEKAHQHDLSVKFEVTEEKGLPHLKNFKVICIVGEYRTEGRGNSKKQAKRKAAELMVRNLHMLPSVPKVDRPRPYFQLKKKKNKSLIKSRATNPEYEASGLNPISRLVQILQATNKKEPSFTVLEDVTLPAEHPGGGRGGMRNRRREFTIQVTADSRQCTGKGPKKKLAKRAAAEEMLKEMGYSSTPPSSAAAGKSALKSPMEGGDDTSGGDRKVTFKEGNGNKVGERKKLDSPIPGHKLAPGLLPMMPGITTASGFPGPMGNQPGPMGSQPGPMGSQPGPMGSQPGPMGSQPGPMGSQPGPMGSQPGPMGNQPGPIGSQPGPIGSLPGPMGNQPGPMGNQPGPMGSQPGPMGSLPGPMGSQPGPMGNQPGPMGSQPGPMGSLPGPIGNQPGTQTSTSPAPGLNRAPGAPVGTPISKKPSPSMNPLTADIARELLAQGFSPSANAIMKGRPGSYIERKLIRPRQQLEFLALTQGLSVQFTDFTEPNKPEQLSLVAVSTDPKLVCHGAGPNIEASHDMAAITALQSLAGLEQEEDIAKRQQNNHNAKRGQLAASIN